MGQETKTGITINRETWKELVKLKLNKDFKTIDETIKFLLKNGIDKIYSIRNNK